MSYKELIKPKKGTLNTELIDKFLNVAMTSTLQEEYYANKVDEQAEKVLKIHNKLLEKHRDIYGISMLLPINNIQQSLIIFNLLKNSEVPKKTKEWENNVILDILKRMPTNRAYKTFSLLINNKIKKISNTRLRWIARQYLREKGKNVMFEGVKYKRTLKALIRHCHVDLKKVCKVEGIEDLERFLFNKERSKIKHKLYKDYLKAKTDKNAVFRLPYSIAEGFKNLHKISNEDFMKKMKKGMTAAEKRRAQGRADKAGVKIAIDLSRETPVNIQKFLRSDKAPDISNTKALKSFERACKNQAEKLFEYFDFDDVKIVIDTSASMYGSREKKHHPIAVGEAVANVLKYLSKETEIVGVPNKAKFLMAPKGASNVWEGILKVLKELDLNKENLVVIISDGYENQIGGGSHQILVAFKKKLDKKEKTIIIQLNPVFAPEAEDVKKLSEAIQTFGIRDTRQLFLILLLAVIRNKKDKKIRQVIEGMKKKVVIREKKKKRKKRT